MNILNTRFATDLPRAEFDDVCAKVAHAFAAVPGLYWKIWTYDEATRQAGGVYLFADAASLDAFVNGPIVQAIRTEDHFSNLEFWSQAVLEEPTRVTRGPLPAAAAAV